MSGGTMTWRQFADAEDGTITVSTYETPIGKAATVFNSRLLSSQVVDREDAVKMLRNGTVTP
jgi:hypothetical protein